MKETKKKKLRAVIRRGRERRRIRKRDAWHFGGVSVKEETSPVIYMPMGTRSRTMFEELVGLSLSRRQQKLLRHARSLSELVPELSALGSNTVRLYSCLTAHTHTRARASHCAESLKREVVYRSRLPSLLAHVRIGFPREISCKVPTTEIRGTSPGFTRIVTGHVAVETPENVQW